MKKMGGMESAPAACGRAPSFWLQGFPDEDEESPLPQDAGNVENRNYTVDQ
jgi:hypothetical protein